MTLSEGNDPVLPDGQSTVVDSALASAAALSAPVLVDPDDIELRDALAAVNAEDTAATAAPADPVQQAAPTPQPQPAGRQPQGDVPAIPKPRFDEMRDRANKATQEAAYWRGVAEARATAPQGQAQPQQAAPTPEMRLAGIHTQIDGLAKKFDDGEISMADFKRYERSLQSAELALREEVLLSRVAPSAAPVVPHGNGDELYLENLTAKLEQDHPWVEVFDKAGTDSDWNFLKAKAIENLVERNIDPTRGTIGKYELRQEMAKLADAFGPALVGSRAQTKGLPLPGGHTAPQQQQFSPQAQARQAKLAMAANAPPDLAAMSGTAGTAPSYTAAQIEAMSDEDIAMLPPSVKAKLLGG